ncbi:hypothetical protein JCGZ_26315 [Jatropha curcas]|uniref:BP28 C-terminal domain-containing protein n=1 Tax=Jatropha curcas TaxID=180498 RepID=A0A067JSG2_JATCU|nr:hypothetical protein JCGZ_26315 [Jatropha curcas]
MEKSTMISQPKCSESKTKLILGRETIWMILGVLFSGPGLTGLRMELGIRFPYSVHVQAQPHVIGSNAKCADFVVSMAAAVPVRGDSSLKLSAVATVEVLAQNFSSNYSVFSMCLPYITGGMNSDSMAISYSCIRTTGALVNVLGPRAFAELPRIMKNVIKISHEMSSRVGDDNSSSRESFMHSILVALEAIVDKLGGFLNPYLEEVTRLMVIGPDYIAESKPKLKLKADIVRRLLSEKIPVRIALPPLLKVYSDAVESGDSSVATTFEMLLSLIELMPNTSVGGNCGKIFELRLRALDLRRQRPVSIKNINIVETSIVKATASLTIKLTESMFKPLFISSIDWEEFSNEGASVLETFQLF